jgi:hypothetical protein
MPDFSNSPFLIAQMSSVHQTVLDIQIATAMMDSMAQSLGFATLEVDTMLASAFRMVCAGIQYYLFDCIDH